MTTQTPRGEIVVSIVTAEVDHATEAAFKAEILPFLDPAPQRLVVDLGDVRYLDSSGIRVLILAARTLAEAGGTLTVVNPQPIVRRVLDVTGVADHLGLDGVSPD